MIKFQQKCLKAGGRALCFKIHKLTSYIWCEEKLSQQWKESVIVFAYKKGNRMDSSSL